MSYRYALIASFAVVATAMTTTAPAVAEDATNTSETKAAVAMENTKSTSIAATSSPEAMRRKGLVLRGGRWILTEEAEILDLTAAQKTKRRELCAKIRRLLGAYAAGDGRARRFVTESLRGIEDDAKLEPFAYALRSPSDALRLFAAAELGRLRNRRALRPLLARAVYDPRPDVRHAAIEAAVAIGDANLIEPLVRALGSGSAAVRTSAAEALGRAGDPRAIKYLVYKFEAHGGGAPRTYFMQAAQVSFIQDFDVEVASTAFIADPLVGTIQEGTVLDVTVVATEQVSHFVEREVVHGALVRLTKAGDVPNEIGAWAKWLRQQRRTAAR